MGAKIDNLKNQLSDGSMRIKVIGTVVVIVIGMVVATLMLRSGSSTSAVPAQAVTSSAPTTNGKPLAPGAQTNPQYDELVRRGNTQMAEAARNTGESAVPAIRAQAKPEPAPEQPKPEPKPDATPDQKPAPPPVDEKRRAAMLKQMNRMMASWDVGRPTQYEVYTKPAAQAAAPIGKAASASVVGNADATSEQALRVSDVGGSFSSNRTNRVLLPAGKEIYYGESRVAINSDMKGPPVVVDMLTGPMKGAVLFGEYTVPKYGDAMVLKFSTAANVQGQAESLPIEAYAVDPDKSGYGVASDVDNHTLSRWGSLLGSSFLQGVGRAVTQMGQAGTYVSTPTQTIVTTNQVDGRQILLSGLGQFGTAWGDSVKENFNRQATVKLNSKVPVGILFTKDVVGK